MPKISVTVGLLGMRIKNKGKTFAAAGAKLRFEGRSLIIKLPFSVIGEPEQILARARTRTPKLPLEASAWRILKIE